jgi:maleylacetoacetate isomerase
MKLYTFFRSTAAYRVRIALNYKNIPCEYVSVNLLADEQRGAEYKKYNKQGRVPTLVDGEFSIGQSMAILEYLEEKYPESPMLPPDTKSKAWVRYLSQIIVCDMHAIMNISSVALYLRKNLHLNENQINNWLHHWLKQGFDSLEQNLNHHPQCKNFCYGETPTFADACLIPQIGNAFRFGFSMDAYPTLMRIYDYCTMLPYFEKSKPENQFDFK